MKSREKLCHSSYFKIPDVLDKSKRTRFLTVEFYFTILQRICTTLLAVFVWGEKRKQIRRSTFEKCTYQQDDRRQRSTLTHVPLTRSSNIWHYTRASEHKKLDENKETREDLLRAVVLVKSRVSRLMSFSETFGNIGVLHLLLQ